jgi:hypothetical protein
VTSRHLRWAAVLILTAAPAAAINNTPQVTGMISPSNPVLADTPGAGVPGPSDTPITLTRVNNTVTVNGPWTCTNGTGTNNLLQLSNPKGGPGGPFQTVTRYNTKQNITQVITITTYDVHNDPTQFTYTEYTGNTTTGTPVRSGIGTLTSSQNTFVYDTLELQQNGGGLNTTVSFLYFNNGFGNLANFLSIPWGQVASLGGKTTACAGGNPQVFVPVASNGRIMWDLNGDNVPDPDLFSSPVVAPQSVAIVPALGPLGIALLAGLLLVVALRWLRRETIGSTPAAP